MAKRFQRDAVGVKLSDGCLTLTAMRFHIAILVMANVAGDCVKQPVTLLPWHEARLNLRISPQYVLGIPVKYGG